MVLSTAFPNAHEAIHSARVTHPFPPLTMASSASVSAAASLVAIFALMDMKSAPCSFLFGPLVRLDHGAMTALRHRSARSADVRVESPGRPGHDSAEHQSQTD